MKQFGTIQAESGLKLRAGPSVTELSLDLMENGDRVEILEQSGNWLKVQWKDMVGWGYATYIKTEAPIPDYCAPEVEPFDWKPYLIIGGMIAVLLLAAASCSLNI